MSIHELPQKPRVIKREEPKPMDDDLRRLCLSMVHLLRRRYPEDFKKIAAEMDRKAA